MSKHFFSQSDLEDLKSRGLTETQGYAQLQTLNNKPLHIKIDRPCKVNDGISIIDRSEIDSYIEQFNEAALADRIMKFVPASGAASRMFSYLLASYKKTDGKNPSISLHEKGEEPSLKCLNNIQRFAFSGDLTSALNKHNLDLTSLIKEKRHHDILEYLLMPKGLNYLELPKALIKFHRYKNYCRTPIEEQLIEAAEYICNKHHVSSVHFTVSPNHYDMIATHVNEITAKTEKSGITFNVTYSTQNPSTDTIAIDEHGHILRDKNNRLLFRQAGHGTLLKNLNDLQADVVFIKNIDNVLPDKLKPETCRYKKILGGVLVKVQRECFRLLNQLNEFSSDEKTISCIADWGRQTLSLTFPKGFKDYSVSERARFLYSKLNRPTRVCGMVKKSESLGGGPFWVEHNDGTQSLQIVETTQINLTMPNQRIALEESTHFNPVDIVCGLRDHRGIAFELSKFSDNTASIVTSKPYKEKTVRILEHPGLWNGGMKNWNTTNQY